MNKIAIFSKKPKQGKTKTRLVPPLTSNEAKELSEAFLKDTMKLIDNLDFIDQKIIYFYPPFSFEYFKAITYGTISPLKTNSPHLSPWLIRTQQGKNLGERLLRAISEELKDYRKKSDSHNKIDKFIVIGSDSPTIPEKYIREAFLILENEDIVLGPAEDGGFYIIGVKKSWPGIFKSVRWSSNDTLKDIILNLEKLSLKFKLLPEWYDVDEITDISKLSKDIKTMPNFYCDNTRTLLNKLERKLKLL